MTGMCAPEWAGSLEDRAGSQGWWRRGWARWDLRWGWRGRGEREHQPYWHWWGWWGWHCGGTRLGKDLHGPGLNAVGRRDEERKARRMEGRRRKRESRRKEDRNNNGAGHSRLFVVRTTWLHDHAFGWWDDTCCTRHTNGKVGKKVPNPWL